MTRTTSGSLTTTLHQENDLVHVPEQCDRCSATVKVYVTKHGMELGFCRHHYNENAVELMANYWTLSHEVY